MRVTTAIIAAALGAGLIAAPASANAPVEAPVSTQRVSYADLNLASMEGQTELQKRLETAAWRVCQFMPDGSLRAANEVPTCYREARQNVAVQFASVMADYARGG